MSRSTTSADSRTGKNAKAPRAARAAHITKTNRRSRASPENWSETEKDAGHSTTGAVAYSDSFFPFPDGPKALIQANVSVIFATSGSVNDQKVIDACVDARVLLYMAPDDTARGFFGH